ncbi:MarR family winged helix-turn-helix transcriptional regulator [Vannielia litorea]|uniref:MarR family winged helix-turn-helix transcriptional regulator n=1 Tax=Vannielia litorea TaxID=1217970 RepID=UPI001BCBAA92|nr:MarR family winged helix-turn-helix transcriptional regulator [Vannielia litorea]MBS8225671.1 MarR family transcriptional regulator [Vannielia litorea]
MSFDLTDFLPYLLNQAAEAASLEFQREYKARYGMLRTEWRVLFHLGRYGEMSARDIVERAMIHKTKVSRAVAALEGRRFLTRREVEEDRRREVLSLTAQGRDAFTELTALAEAHDATLLRGVPEADAEVVRQVLRQIAGL